jgi:hypothetical protein
MLHKNEEDVYRLHKILPYIPISDIYFQAAERKISIFAQLFVSRE